MIGTLSDGGYGSIDRGKKMDCMKIGSLIARLRKEKGLTQKNMADALGLSNKTISKWECGLGCPDLAYWNDLSVILGVDIAHMLEGEIKVNKPDSGNIARVKFYSCETCGNILFSTGSASIFCCGMKLEPLERAKNEEEINLDIQEIDTDYYISYDHPMEKDHYLTFAAYAKSDRVTLVRMYPEQNPSFRIPAARGGTLYLYCSQHGLTAIKLKMKY